MSFLPDWYSQGTNAYTPENKFGQAGMFDKPTAQQQGNFGGMGDKISALIKALRSTDANPAGANMPGSNAMPQYTPYQDQQIGPQMGQVNNPDTMSPNGQIMPNWNRTYGGY
jgi:hypothetical protein